uniref:L-asparaginase n=1 Tax=Romanomermis culicivorax TaxID=13658 RepID=A0A915K1K7_ROMCU
MLEKVRNRRSVFTRDFTIEMDAGLMDGHSGNAAGVGAVSRIKNPIILANEVMSKTPHALLCCSGAEKFAKNCSTNVVFETPEYFQTQIRRQQLENLLKENNCSTEKSDSLGTVGAVAIDENGRLATASSTGGLSGKLSGKFCPVI